MFENILDHPEIVNALKDDIITRRLPSSLLFYGDLYTGKLTTSLELARVLSCEQDSEWGCNCASCEQHRLLDAPNTIMLGSRYFLEEIEACADVLRRNRQTTGQYQFLRAVRKLTRRFDQHIWEGQDSKLKGLGPELEKIEVILDKVYPGNDLPEEKKLDKLLSDSLSISSKIVEFISSENIPINQIRNITSWTHTTFNGSAKVIIVEGVDSMGEASRNALLKIIEEPPPSVYFILISTRKNKIIPTILSRVRPYNFKSRTESEDRNILKRIFKENSVEYRNLRDYFMGMNGINLNIFRQYANKAIDMLLTGSDINIEEYSELLELIDEKHILKIFLEEIICILQLRIPGSSRSEDKNNASIALTVLRDWNTLIQSTISNRTKYNQNTRLLFETLLYQMREVL